MEDYTSNDEYMEDESYSSSSEDDVIVIMDDMDYINYRLSRSNLESAPTRSFFRSDTANELTRDLRNVGFGSQSSMSRPTPTTRNPFLLASMTPPTRGNPPRESLFSDTWRR